MALSVPVTAVGLITTGNTNHPTPPGSLIFGNTNNHDSVAFLWLDRTGGAVINALADNAGGSLAGGQWVARSINGTTDILYVREDVPAQTGFSAQLTTNASQNSQVAGVIIRSDAGGVIYPQYDAIATIATGSAQTIATTNTLTLSAAGLTLGLLSCGNSQATTPTDNASGASIGPAGAAGVRLFATYRVDASGVVAAHSFNVASTNYVYHLIGFREFIAPTFPRGKRVYML